IPKIKTDVISDFHSNFIISPLPTGYGVTMGNALRRILLSSLPGAAITAVKVEGASHEYSTLKGVTESVLDIVLNLKQVHIKKETSDVSTITLEVTKEGEVTAKDIKCPTGVEILNPKQ